MASKLEQNHVSDGASSLVSSDLAVQPIDITSVVPVDGPIAQVDNSSLESIPSPSDSEASSAAALAKSDPSSAAPTVVNVEDNDSGGKNTAPTSGEPVATHDNIDNQDVDHLRTTPAPALAETPVVDAEASDTGDKNATFNSIEPVPTQDIKSEASGPIECEETQDIINEPHGDDRETILRPAPAATTATETKDDGTIEKDVLSASVEPEAGHDIAAVEAPKPARSVPPHLRPSIQSSATAQPRYADIPRAPRSHHANNSFRGFDGREEVARLSAQMMKVRNELDAERKKSTNMRSSIEEEVQKSTDASLARLTTELFQKQVKTLAQQGKLEAKERELLFRQAQIEQTEIFLSEGQKQLYRQASIDNGDDVEESTLSMAEVNREYERRQAELVAQKNLSEREGQLSMRDKALQLREAAQMMREQQYKALIRSTVEAERREDVIPNMDAKLDEVADLEYNRGFGAGKAAGRAAADKGTHEQSFVEGYSAARRAELALNKLKMGSIARDSPELDFLYNASHPYNMFAMGARVGSMDLGKQTSMTNMTQTQGERKPVEVETSIQAQVEKRPVQEQKKAEEAVRR